MSKLRRLDLYQHFYATSDSELRRHVISLHFVANSEGLIELNQAQ